MESSCFRQSLAMRGSSVTLMCSFSSLWLVKSCCLASPQLNVHTDHKSCCCGSSSSLSDGSSSFLPCASSLTDFFFFSSSFADFFFFSSSFADLFFFSSSSPALLFRLLPCLRSQWLPHNHLHLPVDIGISNSFQIESYLSHQQKLALFQRSRENKFRGHPGRSRCTRAGLDSSS